MTRNSEVRLALLTAMGYDKTRSLGTKEAKTLDYSREYKKSAKDALLAILPKNAGPKLLRRWARITGTALAV